MSRSTQNQSQVSSLMKVFKAGLRSLQLIGLAIVSATILSNSINSEALESLWSKGKFPEKLETPIVIASLISVLSIFGESISNPLRDWVQKRGHKLGEDITKAADKTIENLSGIDRKYLEALQAYCYDLEVEGLKADLPPLALKDVFVPLRIDTTVSGSFTSSSSVKRIWYFLPSQGQSCDLNPYRRIAIVADPGYGKTTLTRYLTLSYASQGYRQFEAEQLLPVLLLLRIIYPQIHDQRTPSLPELIQSQVKELPRCQDLEVSTDWFMSRLKDGKCLVMLDGLDEVPEIQRETVSQWINWQMQAYASQFILTSRPHGYEDSLFRGVARLSILDFNNDQKENFINKWYRAVFWHKKWELHWRRSLLERTDTRFLEEQARAQSDHEAQQAAQDLIRQIHQNPELRELAKNPLLITLIAATHRVKGLLPKRRVTLYKKIFTLLLEDRPNRRETRLTIPTAENNQLILQKIALILCSHGKTQFSAKQVSRVLENCFKKYCPDYSLTPRQFLKEIQDIAGLLTGDESDLYQFTHKTFQEYLAAVEIEQQGTTYDDRRKQIQFLTQKLTNSTWKDWQEIIRFYAAMTSANNFIQTILKLEEKEALVLAYRMVVEDKSKLDNKLKNQFYQVISDVDLGRKINAKVRLEKQFKDLVQIQKHVAISEYITWIEYQLFLEAQKTGQFHSTANLQNSVLSGLDNHILKINWSDALWFCAWLSSQVHSSTEVKTQTTQPVYDYRLPTANELRQLHIVNSNPSPIQPWTTSPDIPGEALRFVRVQISDRYRDLLSYLLNGRWKNADQETERILLTLAHRTSEGCFTEDSLKKLPIEDLRIIDRLWLKFSGGKFGFSTQKGTWLEVGGELDFSQNESLAVKSHRKLSERNGWCVKKKWLDYEDLSFSIEAPVGHFPTLYNACRLSSGVFLGSAWRGWGLLFSYFESEI